MPLRKRAGIALVVLTALLLAAAAVCWYAQTALVDERGFSSRATAALDDSEVRTVVADRVVGGLTRNVAVDAQAVRPLLVPALAALADTSAFRRVFARAVSDRHRALIRGDTTFRFELPVGEGLVFEAVNRFAPRIAGAIPPDLRVPVVRLDPLNFEVAGARWLTDLAGWRWPLLLAALLAAAATAALAGGIRTALVHLGMAVAGGGLIVAAAVAGLGEYVVSHAAQAADLSDASERGAVRALWMALFSDLLTAALVAALGGAVVAALASRRSPAGDLSAAWAWARRAAGGFLTPRAGRPGRGPDCARGRAHRRAGPLRTDLGGGGRRVDRSVRRRAALQRQAGSRAGRRWAGRRRRSATAGGRGGGHARNHGARRGAGAARSRAPRPPRASGGRASATVRRPSATGGSTRSRSPPPTTRTPRPRSRAGSSPISATESSASCATASGRS